MYVVRELVVHVCNTRRPPLRVPLPLQLARSTGRHLRNPEQRAETEDGRRECGGSWYRGSAGNKHKVKADIEDVKSMLRSIIEQQGGR